MSSYKANKEGGIKDANNTKTLYFRGKSFMELQEFDKGVATLTELVKYDPENQDGKTELIKAKKTRKDFIDG